MLTPRRCDSCDACCTYPAVEEVSKPGYTRCQHQGSPGCGIYSERPNPCRDYACLWLDGEFEPGDRPDVVGLAFDLPSKIQDHPDYRGVPVICAREVSPGSSGGARATYLLLRLSRKMVVRLSLWGGHVELRGPRFLVDRLVQRAHVRQSAPPAEITE